MARINKERINNKVFYIYRLRNNKTLTSDSLQGFISLVMYIVHNIDLDKSHYESHCALMNMFLDDTVNIELEQLEKIA